MAIIVSMYYVKPPWRILETVLFKNSSDAFNVTITI